MLFPTESIGALKKRQGKSNDEDFLRGAQHLLTIPSKEVMDLRNVWEQLLAPPGYEVSVGGCFRHCGALVMASSLPLLKACATLGNITCTRVVLVAMDLRYTMALACGAAKPCASDDDFVIIKLIFMAVEHGRVVEPYGLPYIRINIVVVIVVVSP